MKRFLLSFSIFFFAVSFCFSQQQKAMSPQKNNGANEQQKKIAVQGTKENKLVTVAGNPHPQQKENPSQNKNKQVIENTQKQSSSDEGTKSKEANTISDDKKNVQPK